MPPADYTVADRRFSALIARHEHLQCLYTGGRWLEGPVYFADLDVLLFSDIPNNRMLRYVDTAVSVFRQPSGFTNGNTRDTCGRLVTCEHGTRRVSRTEHNGSVVTLADRVAGKRFNSPNDVVVKSDGSIWFTDPAYGIMSNYEGHKAESEIGENLVYRIDSAAGPAAPPAEPVAVADGFAQPNGLAFSPDESVLYVADSGRTQFLGEPCHIRQFDVGTDNRLSGGEVFTTVEPGFPDGMRVDVEGNVWTTAGAGVQCYAPDGTLLGRLAVPEAVSNLEFGGRRGNRLFITATTSLYAVYLRIEGVAGR